MWVIAKIKSSEKTIFKKELKKKIDNNIIFYDPKIKLDKLIKNKIHKYSKSLLENYIFCYHEKFKKSNYTSEIRFLRGLEYFLEGYIQNQNQILKFIEYCKSYENEKGFLTQSFFKNMVIKKAKFISGPFTNIIFEILEKQKNKLKILIGDIVTTISSKKNYLYHPI